MPNKSPKSNTEIAREIVAGALTLTDIESIGAQSLRKLVDAIESALSSTAPASPSHVVNCPRCSAVVELSRSAPAIDAQQLKAIERIHVCPRCDAACLCKSARDIDTTGCVHCAIDAEAAREIERLRSVASCDCYENIDAPIPPPRCQRLEDATWKKAIEVAAYQFDMNGSGAMMLASMRKAREVAAGEEIERLKERSSEMGGTQRVDADDKEN